MNLTVITVSDSVAGGRRADASGDSIVDWAIERGYKVASRVTVADESVDIVRALLDACDGAGSDLVVTTGGTGLAKRDVTPEATRAVIDAEAPGFVDQMRDNATRFPRAVLSRGIAGVRGRTLIVNLPGSVGGVRDGLAVLTPIVEHACDILSGRATEHGNAHGA
ncbi:MAG: MogA/MoaB family molybdenum cofactor biosynthesis protein [Gemmatimonadaceae bacterium]